jgi:hypothetical protein
MSQKGSGHFKAYGLKEYTFGDELALKGVPLTTTDEKTGKKTVDYTLGFKYLKGERIEYPRMAGFMESVRAGESTLRYVKSSKMKHVIVQKRARTGEHDTRPWHVDELKQQILKKGKT